MPRDDVGSCWPDEPNVPTVPLSRQSRSGGAPSVPDNARRHGMKNWMPGRGKGFSGLDNPLFYKVNCEMLYGDAKESIVRLTQAVHEA